MAVDPRLPAHQTSVISSGLYPCLLCNVMDSILCLMMDPMLCLAR